MLGSGTAAQKPAALPPLLLLCPLCTLLTPRWVTQGCPVPLSPHEGYRDSDWPVWCVPGLVSPILSEGSSSFPSWLCFSALISRQLPPTTERAQHECRVSGEHSRHTRQIYSSARGFVPWPSAGSSPFQLPEDSSDVVAQISHHTLGSFPGLSRLHQVNSPSSSSIWIP